MPYPVLQLAQNQHPGLACFPGIADNPDMTLSIKQSKNLLSFDQFSFDPETLELFKQHQRIALAPKPAQLLHALIKTAPGVVSRANAQTLLWPNSAFIEIEQGLNACVRQLRTALGDNANSPSYIETLPKRGYRLIVPVRVATEPTANARYWPTSMVAGLILFIIAIVVLLNWNNNKVDQDLATQNTKSLEYLTRAQALRDRNQNEDMENALALYEALSLELPRSAAALAGKAFTLSQLAVRNWSSAQQNYNLALEFARAADTIQPLPDAAAAQGFAQLNGALNPELALAHFQAALKLDNNHIDAYLGMAAALSALGQHSQAIDAATTAARLSPRSYSARSDRCWYMLFDDRYAEALDACSWATEIDGNHSFSYLGVALAAENDPQRAEQALQNYLLHSQVQFKSGDIQNGGISCNPAARMVEHAETGKTSSYETAALYALCGQLEQTRFWLMQATQEQYPAIMYYPADPRFDSLRSQLPSLKTLLPTSPFD